MGGSVRGSFYIGGGIDEEGGADDEGVRGVWFFSWFDVSCVSAIFCDFSLRRFQALNVL